MNRMAKIDTKYTKLTDDQKYRIKTICWMLQRSSIDYILHYVNSGILGYTNETYIDDKGRERYKPIKTSRGVVQRIREESLEPDQIKHDFEEFTEKGFTIIVRRLLSELEELHEIALHNMNMTTDNLKKQHIVESIVHTIIPAYTQYSDLLRRMLKYKMLKFS